MRGTTAKERAGAPSVAGKSYRAARDTRGGMWRCLVFVGVRERAAEARETPSNHAVLFGWPAARGMRTQKGDAAPSAAERDGAARRERWRRAAGGGQGRRGTNAAEGGGAASVAGGNGQRRRRRHRAARGRPLGGGWGWWGGRSGGEGQDAVAHAPPTERERGGNLQGSRGNPPEDTGEPACPTLPTRKRQRDLLEESGP